MKDNVDDSIFEQMAELVKPDYVAIDPSELAELERKYPYAVKCGELAAIVKHLKYKARAIKIIAKSLDDEQAQKWLNDIAAELEESSKEGHLP